MPSYKYVCDACGQVTNEIRLIADRNNEDPCGQEKCSGTKKREPEFAVNFESWGTGGSVPMKRRSSSSIYGDDESGQAYQRKVDTAREAEDKGEFLPDDF